MTRIFVHLIQIFMLIIAIAESSYAQKNQQCNFSKYKPLLTIVNSHLTKSVKEVKPEYPSLARSIGARGLVVVIVVIDKKGNVRKACSNIEHPLLRIVAIKAALEWKFKPNFGFTSEISYRYLQTYLSFNFH